MPRVSFNVFRIPLSALNSSAKSIFALTPLDLTRLVIKSVDEIRDVRWWKLTANRVKSIADEMIPWQLSSVAFSFGKQKLRDRDMFIKIAASSCKQISKFTTKDISFLLGAFSRVEFKSDVLFSVCSRELAKKANEITPKELSEIFHSFTHLEYEHPILFRLLGNRVLMLCGNSRKFQGWQIARLFISLQLIRCIEDTRVFAVLSAEACKHIGEFSSNDLSSIAHAASKLRYSNRLLNDLLVDESYKKRLILNASSVAMCLSAFSKQTFSTCSALHQFFDYFAEQLCREKNLKKLSSNSIVQICRAFARVRYHLASAEKCHALFSTISKVISDDCRSKDVNSGFLSSFKVASLIRSFAETKHIDDFTFSYLIDWTTRNYKDFSVHEISRVFESITILAIPHDAFLETVLPALPDMLREEAQRMSKENADDLDFPGLLTNSRKPRQSRAGYTETLCSLLESLRRFYLTDEILITFICEELKHDIGLLTADKLCMVEEALQVLGVNSTVMFGETQSS